MNYQENSQTLTQEEAFYNNRYKKIDFVMRKRARNIIPATRSEYNKIIQLFKTNLQIMFQKTCV